MTQLSYVAACTVKPDTNSDKVRGHRWQVFEQIVQWFGQAVLSQQFASVVSLEKPDAESALARAIGKLLPVPSLGLLIETEVL